jgi:hypothetical protein
MSRRRRQPRTGPDQVGQRPKLLRVAGPFEFTQSSLLETALESIVNIYAECEMAGDRSRHRDGLGAPRDRRMRKRFAPAGQRRRPFGRDERAERRHDFDDGDHERRRPGQYDDGPRRLVPLVRRVPGGVQMRSLRGPLHGAGVRVRIALRQRRGLCGRSWRPHVADLPAEGMHRQVWRRGRRLVRSRRQLRGLRNGSGLRRQRVRRRGTERRRPG